LDRSGRLEPLVEEHLAGDPDRFGDQRVAGGAVPVSFAPRIPI
jgi:hypothetical protein